MSKGRLHRTRGMGGASRFLKSKACSELEPEEPSGSAHVTHEKIFGKIHCLNARIGGNRGRVEVYSGKLTG